MYLFHDFLRSGAWNCQLDAWNCLWGAWNCLLGAWTCLFEIWVLGIVFWVLGLVFWVLGIVFWVLGRVFWVLGIVFWVPGNLSGAGNCILVFRMAVHRGSAEIHLLAAAPTARRSGKAQPPLLKMA